MAQVLYTLKNNKIDQYAHSPTLAMKFKKKRWLGTMIQAIAELSDEKDKKQCRVIE